MEENNKLFVFDKKEVVLIFVFIVVIAVTTFTLGVRIGKQLSLKEDGYTKKDVESVNLKSVEEEYVEKVVGSQDAPPNFEGALGETPAALPSEAAKVEDVEARLREEMAKLAAGQTGAEAEDVSVQETVQNPDVDSAPAQETPQSSDELYSPGRDVSGKFTIQLYANQSKAAAQDFADAFIVKGYDVIINEAEIPGKGTWYRVSVGIFDTIGDAKTYLQKEKDLFKGEDYIIQQL